MNIDGLLRDWGNLVLKEIEVTGYRPETVISRYLKCQISSINGTIPIPGYWPDQQISEVNNLIWALPIEDRNLIVGQRILGYSYKELGQLINLTKWAAMKRIDKIETKILENLKKSPVWPKMCKTYS